MKDNYRDILNQSRPKPCRPPMPMEERAKIFAPFAALRGFDEAIKRKQKSSDLKIELTEDEKEQMDRIFQQLKESLKNKENRMITAVYYELDEESGLGHYTKRTGILTGISRQGQSIRIAEDEIPMDQVIKLIV